jgi:hypothetical protein
MEMETGLALNACVRMNEQRGYRFLRIYDFAFSQIDSFGTKI